MKIYVINLKKDINKRQRIISMFQKLNISNYEIFDAVNGNELNHFEINKKFSSVKALKKHMRKTKNIRFYDSITKLSNEHFSHQNFKLLDNIQDWIHHSQEHMIFHQTLCHQKT